MRIDIGKHLSTALCTLILSGVSCGIAHPVTAAAVPAQPAHNFVNSVGLTTYFGWPDSPYWTSYAKIKARLAELGVRHVRNGVNEWSAAILRDLYLILGVRTLATVDLRKGSGAQQRLDPSQIKPHLDFIRKNVGIAPLVGLEGPNEYNILERVYGYTEWPTDLRRFQEQLYTAVRSDPDFVGRKVIQPALSGPNSSMYYARMGDYSNIADIGNLHIYPNWSTWEKGATREYDGAQNTMPGRPFWSTETGWHSATTGQSLDTFTMLRYLPRALLGFGSFRNVKRGYIFQLIDYRPDPSKTIQDSNYGLIDYDGNVKPGFYAVRNMMHVLCDDPLRSSPGVLRYSLSGNLADVRTLLYKKNNGAFYLATWLEKPGKVGVSPTESRNIIYPPQAVTINFEQGISLVRRYEPGDPYGDVTVANDAKQRYSNPRTLNISVRDSVTILEIVPAGVVTPAINKSCTFKPTA